MPDEHGKLRGRSKYVCGEISGRGQLLTCSTILQNWNSIELFNNFYFPAWIKN
jgi:hypothetical protein